MPREDEQTREGPSQPDGPRGIVDSLAQLSFLIQDALARVAAEHDLSSIQTRLLGMLRDRSPGMNELARYLELDKSSVTGLVDRAERRGLVRRKVSAADRRGVEVSITAAGRKIVQRAEAEFGARVAAFVGPLTGAERTTLASFASRIVVEAAKGRGIGLAAGGDGRTE